MTIGRSTRKIKDYACRAPYILAVVVLIIGVVLDSYLTAGLSKN
jgi:hypothetical protein